MKKLICVLLTLIVCLSMASCGSGPSIGENGLEFTRNDDKKSYTVSGIGECSDADVVIPALYEERAVTRIGDGAFRNCAQMTSVTIPNSVTRIGSAAFEGCTSLTIIYYNGTVTAWNNINKADDWDQSIDCTIRCTNGDIGKI